MNTGLLDGIMGLCVGDALGVPVEFQSRKSLQKNPVTDMQGYGTYNKPPGTWSDDTSMTLCLTDSLVNGLDYQDMMERFIRWYQKGLYTPQGEVFDVGNTTRMALERYMNGRCDPLHCGGVEESDNGNGSLMRILPLVFHLHFDAKFTKDPHSALEIIHNVSGLTHGHKRSQAACALYCFVAHCLLDGNNLEFSIAEGIESVRTLYEGTEDFMEELHYFRRLWDLQSFSELPEAEIRSNGYVVHTLESAFWCLLTTDSYSSCVLKAVNLGEDTDTVAAVAGGLAGLAYGMGAIPISWRNTIMNSEEVERICRKLESRLSRDYKTD